MKYDFYSLAGALLISMLFPLITFLCLYTVIAKPLDKPSSTSSQSLAGVTHVPKDAESVKPLKADEPIKPLKDVIVPLGSALIGGLAALLVAKWQLQKTARIAYISGVFQNVNVVQRVQDIFGKLIQLERGENQDMLKREALEENVSFQILMGGNEKSKEEFLHFVEHRKWTKARDRLYRYLTGK